MLDAVEGAWRLDVMLEPGDAETWVFRRHPAVRSPRPRLVGVRDGVPYLRPEAVLLYKAKLLRDKDEADFSACLPGLEPESRRWLADALRVVHPDHAWIARVMNPAGG